jgi:hypothetical protein
MSRLSGLNGVRGDVSAVIDGRKRKLCVTFGALAEIETELGVGDMADLTARLRRLSAQDLWVVISALLRGAGESDVALVDHAEANVAELASAVAAAFREVAA